MHRTLKAETTPPARANIPRQQATFDLFVTEFNTKRPHEALNTKAPADLYAPSSRAYAGLPDLHYPFHDLDIAVTNCVLICMHRKGARRSRRLRMVWSISMPDEARWCARAHA
ncbi:hypothetical protein MesoLjLb_32040 [Mesorhizobium sp. L-8-3]|nr:hypothetical protein MesoLjLb_32040 [Mesorhizobium sp. L-8-3]